MSTSNAKIGFLSNNALKIIAAVFMVCDHTGMLLFPKVDFLRCIGRLAFPIFAYLIAEGAKHTKNRLRYFLIMSGFATGIQVCYYIFAQSLEMSVMVTFTLSLMIIFALDLFKSTVFSKHPSVSNIAVSAALLISAVVFAATLDMFFDYDYRFYGCLLPVLPSILTTPRVDNPPEIFKKLDSKIPRVFAASIGILMLAIIFGENQHYGLLAIPLLLMYSEERGRLKLKYFFYVFYPLHLVVLHFIEVILDSR
jgi:hypothetical protein